MRKLFKYIKNLFALPASKERWQAPTWVHFVRKGPNHYMRRTDGQVFTAWQMRQMKKEANERNELFIVQVGDDYDHPSREEDVIM